MLMFFYDGYSDGNKYLLDLPNAKNLLRNTGSFIMEVKRGHYNCGGFALGMPEWYLPYDEDTQDEIYGIREDMEYGANEYACCTAIGEIMVDYMCKTENVRRIYDDSELKENEYLVLFKASYDDFHYVRRTDDGKWYHKNGGSRIMPITEDQAYDDDWWYDLPCGYNGDLFMLAVEKPNHQERRIKRKSRERKYKVRPRRIQYGYQVN